MQRFLLKFLISGFFGVLVSGAHAHEQSPVSQSSVRLAGAHSKPPLLHLEANAQAEVATDLASVQWFCEVSDSSAAAASSRASALLTEALGKLDGATAVLQRRTGLKTYTNNYSNGKIAGWRARAEITLEGTDFVELSKAGQRIAGPFAIGNIGYRLSDTARKREEARLTAEAVSEFRDKAAQAARFFGFSGYELAEVQVSQSQAPELPQRMMMVGAARADTPAPLEGGLQTLQVSVRGAVQPAL
ncbi:MAG: SIMPL domain-containing protein [Burkholderiaceae bacterium]|jgi:predicted secreted protein